MVKIMQQCMTVMLSDTGVSVVSTAYPVVDCDRRNANWQQEQEQRQREQQRQRQQRQRCYGQEDLL